MDNVDEFFFWSLRKENFSFFLIYKWEKDVPKVDSVICMKTNVLTFFLL